MVNRKTLSDAKKYYDLKYYRQALKQHQRFGQPEPFFTTESSVINNS